MMRFLTARRSFMVTAMSLLFAATLVQAGQPANLQDHADFGIAPDTFTVGRLEPTSSDPPSLRDQLVREGILDSATLKSQDRSSVKARAGQNVVEELPAPTARSVSPESGSSTKPAPESVGPAARQPTLAEKIQHRYSDPRIVRLLDRMTAQSSVSLFVASGPDDRRTPHPTNNLCQTHQ